jgi:hypothetical protein
MALLFAIILLLEFLFRAGSTPTVASAGTLNQLLEFRKVSSKPHSTSMHATLDIFSGQPNPSWMIDKESADLLIKRIQHLPRTVAKTLPRDKLGYRGIEITVEDPPKAGITRILLYKGFVTLNLADDQILYLADRKKTIEPWLLHLARTYLSDEVILVALHEINSSTGY